MNIDEKKNTINFLIAKEFFLGVFKIFISFHFLLIKTSEKCHFERIVISNTAGNLQENHKKDFSSKSARRNDKLGGRVAGMTI